MWSSISEEVILEQRPEGSKRGGDANTLNYLKIIQAEESALAKTEAKCAWQPVENRSVWLQKREERREGRRCD